MARARTATKSRTKRASVLEQRAAQPLATTNGAPARGDRIGVRKTYKLYIGGAFPRTESGRAYEIYGAKGELLANACRGTRKDIREAVRAARKAQPGWGAKTAYNRSQILYRIAELMEGRRAQFEAELADAGASDPGRGVDAAIDRWVWYAGWADKYAQVLGSSNPVAAPYFNFTVPEPTGIAGIVAPEEPPLAGLVSRLAPAKPTGPSLIAASVAVRALAAWVTAVAEGSIGSSNRRVEALTGTAAQRILDQIRQTKLTRAAIAQYIADGRLNRTDRMQQVQIGKGDDISRHRQGQQQSPLQDSSSGKLVGGNQPG